jgi:CheY-like chemotaxis protein
MDMMMPLMDGATAIYGLREINPQVNIIAVSGLTNSKQIAKMMGNEIKAFLAKPYTSEELLKILHDII